MKKNNELLKSLSECQSRAIYKVYNYLSELFTCSHVPIVSIPTLRHHSR